MLIASMKRRPLNQSAITLFCSTIIATAPTPDTVRPAAMPSGPPAQALMQVPATMQASPPPSTSRSP